VIEYESLRETNRSFMAEYQEAFGRVLASGWYVLGAEVAAFEREFAAYCGVAHCVGVANGLDALVLALRAFGFAPGSEVIVPSNTYIASIIAVAHAGLVPVPVEPDAETLLIDAGGIERRITGRTAAVMVVHLYGAVCDMPPIQELCRRRGLRLVEDCAQSHGAACGDRRAGSFGDFGAFSFYPTKNLGCLGDGGALTTDDAQLADRVRCLRNYGSRVKYHNELLGVNSRLDEVQAAFLRVKLPRLDEINAHKAALAAEYRAGLPPAVTAPRPRVGFRDAHHIFPVRHPRRDALKAYLLERGIKTDIHYPVSPNRQPALRGIMDEPCPVSEEIHSSVLSLPISFGHTREDVREVCRAVRDFAAG
jgi:dTDP-4-amino-4,6-dideoxygalactose transaminase